MATKSIYIKCIIALLLVNYVSCESLKKNSRVFAYESRPAITRMKVHKRFACNSLLECFNFFGTHNNVRKKPRERDPYLERIILLVG